MKKSRRKVVVFSSLLGVLSLTSILLLVLAPTPLTPDAPSNLYASDAPSALDSIFDLKNTPARPWKYIYIHQSATAAGDASTRTDASGQMSDHFLIGNGNGSADGEIFQGPRWDRQLAAAPPTVDTRIDPNCVSVCLVGDFDRTVPTQSQLDRLAQLVGTLQARYRISADRVMLVTKNGSPAGIGRFFPIAGFRDQISQ